MTEEQTVELIDIATLKPINKTSDEWRYICPVCPEKRGKPDKDGKFYWNIHKNMGYCFKCGTSFFPEGSGDYRLSKEEVEWNRTIEDWDRRLNPDAIFKDLEFPKEVSFSFPELTQDLMVALKKRNPFLIPLIPSLGLRAWKGRDTGIVIPFFYNGKICRFQCRFVTKNGRPLDKKDMKYYTSPGEAKPLYSPFHIFGDFQTVGGINHLTIAEGVFDSIALAILRFPNPVAVLGNRLTPLHIWDIRHLNPLITKIHLCLDDTKLNDAMEKVIRKFLPCVEEVEKFSFWLPNFKDVEEWLVGNLTREDLKKACTEMVIEWVKASKGEDTP